MRIFFAKPTNYFHAVLSSSLPFMASASPTSSLTELLQRYSSGDRAIADALFREIWPVLHQLAVRQLTKERSVAPVSPTELISELWLRNLNRGGWNINNREHFYAIVAMAMRRVLIDLARQRLAASRGSGYAATSLADEENASIPSPVHLEEVIHIGQLMESLEKKDPLAALIADMHYFAGYTLEEIANTTGLSLRQVGYRWKKTENWLKRQLDS
jgi:RNA polymerase sigma factor (TIGR02999 family)